MFLWVGEDVVHHQLSNALDDVAGEEVLVIAELLQHEDGFLVHDHQVGPCGLISLQRECQSGGEHESERRHDVLVDLPLFDFILLQIVEVNVSVLEEYSLGLSLHTPFVLVQISDDRREHLLPLLSCKMFQILVDV